MSETANKTFFKFLFGFLTIIALSFVVIIGTTYLSESAETQTATPSEEVAE